jgi:hypothetical protein
MDIRIETATNTRPNHKEPFYVRLEVNGEVVAKSYAPTQDMATRMALALLGKAIDDFRLSLTAQPSALLFCRSLNFSLIFSTSPEAAPVAYKIRPFKWIEDNGEEKDGKE